MAYININLDALEKAKNDVASYNEKQKRIISQMQNVIDSTGQGWEGEDQKQFMIEWDKLNAADGVFTVSRKNIENYEKVLENALNAYKKAQSESAEQAAEV